MFEKSNESPPFRDGPHSGGEEILSQETRPEHRQKSVDVYEKLQQNNSQGSQGSQGSIIPTRAVGVSSNVQNTSYSEMFVSKSKAKIFILKLQGVLKKKTLKLNTIFMKQKINIKSVIEKIRRVGAKNTQTPNISLDASLSSAKLSKQSCNIPRLFKRYPNLQKGAEYICTSIQRVAMAYLRTPNMIARKVGIFFLLFSISLIAYLNVSLGYPDSALPLEHTYNASNDRVGSSYISNTADSTQDASLFKETYRIEATVKKGDTLGKILSRAGVANDTRHNSMYRDIKQTFDPKSVFIGQKILLDVAGGYVKDSLLRIERMELFLTLEKSVVVSWDSSAKKYRARMALHPLKKQEKSAKGVINSSLYLAMEKQGVKRSAIVDFINLFSFDVDFQRDIRKNDSFDIVYKEYLSENGAYVRSGDIAVAELTVQGHKRRYYQYKTKGKIGYYDASGKSGQKALMKTPIEGARLSSGFGSRRHPVLGYTKKHNGTDFAAPKGTPIFAAGDGVVEYAGRKGANGIYIRLRHNSTYKTAYLHMSGIAKGVRRGRTVRQGEVIGYVGSTGRSTGNHLHYSVFKNGIAINSRTMKLPSGVSLKGAELAKFKTHIAKYQ